MMRWRGNFGTADAYNSCYSLAVECNNKSVLVNIVRLRWAWRVTRSINDVSYRSNMARRRLRVVPGPRPLLHRHVGPTPLLRSRRSRRSMWAWTGRIPLLRRTNVTRSTRWRTMRTPVLRRRRRRRFTSTSHSPTEGVLTNRTVHATVQIDLLPDHAQGLIVPVWYSDLLKTKDKICRVLDQESISGHEDLDGGVLSHNGMVNA